LTKNPDENKKSFNGIIKKENMPDQLKNKKSTINDVFGIFEEEENFTVDVEHGIVNLLIR